MAMTAAERRRKDRERKAAARVKAKALGAPQTATVQNAIVEATAFALTSVNIDAGPDRPAIQSIDIGLVMRTATAILARRGGFDEQQSKRAIKRLLSPRAEHRWPAYTPSLYPITTATAA